MNKASVYGRQPCQIYLTVSADRPNFPYEAIGAVLKRFAVPCLLLTAPNQGAYVSGIASKTMDICHANDAAFLIENDIELAADLGADGLHITADNEIYDRARSRLGQEIQIGVAGGHSRHQAMQLAEQGADYVAFGDGRSQTDDTLEMIAWWSGLFEVPCVAWGACDVDDARRYMESGADFVALADRLWLDRDQTLTDLASPSAMSSQSNGGREA